MLRNTTLVVLALAVQPAAEGADRNDDAAWLQRAMSAPMAPGVPVPAERAQRIDFPALARLTGQPRRIAEARSKHGVVAEGPARIPQSLETVEARAEHRPRLHPRQPSIPRAPALEFTFGRCARHEWARLYTFDARTGQHR